MADNNIYVVSLNDVSVSGAISLLQIKAGATVPVELVRAVCSQRTVTTSTWQRIQILRKTAAATVTSFTPLKLNPNDPAANAAGGTAATGTNASAEGTDGDVLVPDVWNVLTPWLWLPTPDEKVWVPAAGFLALKFPTAPGSAMTVTASFWFREQG